MFYLRRVVGESMLPSARPGQLVLFWRRRRYKIGDVVLVRHGGLEKIKRIAKISGDKVFLTGDNPAASTDSRHFGLLPIKQIAGSALALRKKR